MKKATGRDGFTLIELMAVIGIIAALVGLVMAGAGLASRQADRNRARAELAKIQTALNRYVMDYTKYPSNITHHSVWQVLTNYVPGITMVDPWGNTNRYSRLKGFHHITGAEREREDAYELRSAGPDGIFNTADDIVTSRQD